MQCSSRSGAGADRSSDGPNTKGDPAMQVSDFLVERLQAWDVEHVFGYSGDAINGILGALDRAGNRPEFVPTPHEELAALMACGYAKFSGKVGVCLATSGPGAIHLLNGLYDANLDGAPVVAIVGQQARGSLGSHYQQDLDLHTLFKDVAGSFVQTIESPEQARHLLDRAFRIALAERTVTCVIVPHDLQELDAVEAPPPSHGMQHSGVGYRAPRVLPADDDLRRAADVLNSGEKVAMLVGAGALAATDELLAVAERLGAGVAKALLGKGAAPDDLPYVTGVTGWLGTAASNHLLAECDTLLMVGSGFPYTEFLPREGQARGVQIDIDARMLSLRYPMEVNLVGDAAETLRALLPLLRQHDGPWRREIERRKAAWLDRLAADARQPADPLNPQLIFHKLSPRLPDNVILAADSGSSTVWYARYLQMRRGMVGSVSGTLATMGCALPYALAAKFAHPGRPAVALVGDGAMQMNGLNTLLAVARFRERWDDPCFVVLVLNNRDLNFVTWEQRLMEGIPRFPAAQDLPDFPYADFARSLGLEGARIDAPEQVGDALDRAFAARVPFVIDAVVDPDVPNAPPELRQEQRDKLAQALAAGDPDAQGVLAQMRAQGLLQANDLVGA